MSLGKRPERDFDTSDGNIDADTTPRQIIPYPSTPRRVRAASAPASSPMSVMEATPVKKGRPFKKIKHGPSVATTPAIFTPATAGPSTSRQQPQTQSSNKSAARAQVKLNDRTIRSRDAFAAIKKPRAENGYGFNSLYDFLDTLMNSQDQTIKATMTRFAQHHSSAVIEALAKRAPTETRKAAVQHVVSHLRSEGYESNLLDESFYWAKSCDLSLPSRDII